MAQSVGHTVTPTLDLVIRIRGIAVLGVRPRVPTAMCRCMAVVFYSTLFTELMYALTESLLIVAFCIAATFAQQALLFHAVACHEISFAILAQATLLSRHCSFMQSHAMKFLLA